MIATRIIVHFDDSLIMSDRGKEEEEEVEAKRKKSR